MRYRDPFIIEHRSYGVFSGWNDDKTRPRFRSSIKRPEGVRFPTYAAARNELKKFPSRWRHGYIHKLGTMTDAYQPSRSETHGALSSRF